jgi:hypothetical protein
MPPLKTDDEILNTIPGMDEPTGTGDGEAGTTTQTAEAATTTADNTSNVNASTGADSGSGGTNAAPAPGDKPATQKPADAPRNPDGSRDLIDPNTGRVIARGGTERRFYEDAQRFRRQAERTQQDLTRTQSRVRELEAATSLGKELGLSPTQQVAAMRAMADLMRDPVTTLTAIITDLRASGVNLDTLFQNATGIDMAAINKTIDTKLQPVLKPQQDAQRQQEVHVEAQRTLDTFLDTNPDAEHNLEVIAQLMREGGLDLPTAYTKLVEWSASNGYDHRQPLMPQMAARRGDQASGEQQQQAPATTQPTTPQHTKPIPNGRPVVADTSADGNVTDVQNNTVYHENVSWKTALAAELKAHGLELN